MSDYDYEYASGDDDDWSDHSEEDADDPNV